MKCPACGGFGLVPHCARQGCAGQWCSRGACGWSTGDACSAPEPEPARSLRPAWPDSTVSGGFRRMHLKPVRQMGQFTSGILGARRLVGWVFDESTEHAHKPAWSADLLYEMITTTLQGIRALPGPSVW